MRHLRLALLGLLLVLPFGCGGKSEADKSDSAAKSENAGVQDPKKSPDKTTAIAKTPDRNTPNKSAPREVTQPKDLPVIDVPPSDGSEFAMVPKGATVLFSARPAAVLASRFLRSLPEQDELKKNMAEMKAEVGFDVSGIASVTLALWPGDGHVIPDLPQTMMPQGGGRSDSKTESFKGDFDEKSEDFGDKDSDEEECNAQPPGGPGGGMIQQMILGLAPKFDGAVYLRFEQPIDLKKLQQAIPPLRGLQADTFEGKDILVEANLPVGGGVAVYQANPKTVVITFKDDLGEILNNQGESPLVTQAKSQGSSTDVALLIDFQPFQALIGMAGQFVGSQIKGGGKVLTQLQGVSLFVDLNDGVDVNVMLDAKDEQTVQTLKAEFDTNFQALEGQISQAAEKAPPGTSEETKAASRKLAQEIYDSVKSEANGKQFRISVRIPDSASEVFQRINEEQRRRMMGINNLKQIGVACHNYHEVYGKYPFPAGIFDAGAAKAGKLSWLVHLLPYVDQGGLYDEFKLDQPWDSEHNKALLEKMPDIYKLNEGTKAGYTQLVAPAGSGFVVDGDKARRVVDFTDGTSNSIMVLTVKPEHAMPWTKPGGTKIDPAKAAEMLGGQGPQFLALCADGGTHRLPTSIDAEDLKAFLTIAGGEVVNHGLLFGAHFDDGGFGASTPSSADFPDDVRNEK